MIRCKTGNFGAIFINLLSIYAIFLVFLLNYVKDIYQEQPALKNDDSLIIVIPLVWRADI